jgi:hypothetical protein
MKIDQDNWIIELDHLIILKKNKKMYIKFNKGSTL